MKTFIAFLRAVNVGGTGKLPMSDLRTLCEEIGFEDVKTYIASGNLVFKSNKNAKTIKALLESKLRDYAGKDVSAIVRSASELQRVLEENPFPDKKPNFTVALFLDKKPPKDTLSQVTGQVDEEIQLGQREIFVYYRSGVGSSKLKFPAQKIGTARNFNTIKKMVNLAA